MQCTYVRRMRSRRYAGSQTARRGTCDDDSLALARNLASSYAKPASRNDTTTPSTIAPLAKRYERLSGSPPSRRPKCVTACSETRPSEL